jgi:hypothetical protein
MADERNPNENIEDDDATRRSDEAIVGIDDDDEEFEDAEDEDGDEGVEEGE